MDITVTKNHLFALAGDFWQKNAHMTKLEIRFFFPQFIDFFFCVMIFVMKFAGTVDARNPAPVEIYKTHKPCKYWDICHINWCRISSFNSIIVMNAGGFFRNLFWLTQAIIWKHRFHGSAIFRFKSMSTIHKTQDIAILSTWKDAIPNRRGGWSLRLPPWPVQNQPSWLWHFFHFTSPRRTTTWKDQRKIHSTHSPSSYPPASTWQWSCPNSGS